MLRLHEKVSWSVVFDIPSIVCNAEPKIHSEWTSDYIDGSEKEYGKPENALRPASCDHAEANGK